MNYISPTLQGIGALLIGIAALLGLDAWRKQLSQKRDDSLAKEILIATIKLRDSLYFFRYDLMFFNKDVLTSEQLRSSHENQMAYSKINQYNNKWKEVNTFQLKLKVLLQEAEAIWGIKINEKFKDMFYFVAQTRTFIEEYLNTIDPDLNNTKKQLSIAAYEEELKRFKYFKDESFNNKMDELLEPCLSIIRSRLVK